MHRIEYYDGEGEGWVYAHVENYDKAREMATDFHNATGHFVEIKRVRDGMREGIWLATQSRPG